MPHLTVADVAAADALSRYRRAQQDLQDSAALEARCFTTWLEMAMRFGPIAPAPRDARAVWESAARLREGEATALAKATEELHEALRAVAVAHV